VAGAIFSGIAGLIIAMALRSVLKLHDYLQPTLREPRQAAADDEPAVGLLHLQRAAHRLMATAPGDQHLPGHAERQFAPLFWTMVLVNFVLPVLILSSPFPHNHRLRHCLIGIVIGMWLERVPDRRAVTGPQVLPYSWGTYSPRPTEISYGRYLRGHDSVHAVREVHPDHLHLGDAGRRAPR
jgi:hypothetical protein